MRDHDEDILEWVQVRIANNFEQNSPFNRDESRRMAANIIESARRHFGGQKVYIAQQTIGPDAKELRKREMARAVQAGAAAKDVANEYGVSLATVYRASSEYPDQAEEAHA